MQFQQNQKIVISGGTVTVGTITGTVNVAGTVAISGGSVSITGTPNVNVTGGSISISSGSVSITAGTITSITNAVNVLQAVFVLYKNSLLSIVAPFNTTVTATGASLSQRVFIQNLAGGGSAQILIQVNNNTTGEFFEEPINLASGAWATVGIPVSANNGDSLTLNLSAVGTVGSVAIVWDARGDSSVITTPPGDPISNFPVGGTLSIGLAWPANGVRSTVLAAPPSGMAYRIQAISSDTATIAYIIGNGGAVMAVGPGQGTLPMNGQISFATIQVQPIAGGGTGTCFIMYDLIALPSII